MAAWLKQAAADINSVLIGIGQTIHELAGSKRAALGALAVAVPVLAQAFPSATWIAQVTPVAEGVFAVLAVLDTLRPLGVPTAKG